MLQVVGEKLMSQLKGQNSKLEMLVEAAQWQREDERVDRINLVRLLEEMCWNLRSHLL